MIRIVCNLTATKLNYLKMDARTVLAARTLTVSNNFDVKTV